MSMPLSGVMSMFTLRKIIAINVSKKRDALSSITQRVKQKCFNRYPETFFRKREVMKQTLSFEIERETKRGASRPEIGVDQLEMEKEIATNLFDL